MFIGFWTQGFKISITMNTLKTLRKQYKLSQKELSILTGLSENRIQKLEIKGYIPTYEEISILSNFYNIEHSDMHSMLFPVDENVEKYYIFCV